LPLVLKLATQVDLTGFCGQHPFILRALARTASIVMSIEPSSCDFHKS
jgi:hypothetical protein